ncbi:hypothetical protein PDJAM_G00119420 [Pangasius djambal]|uniref:Uncharacterized protein n=1 Tax=Pangasius djambal TaxID=1691987 RepID=A0ACC5Z912_9TELE|nr:hypothetical protein [Pangasius djambal]
MNLKKSRNIGASSISLDGVGKQDADSKRKRKMAEITQALNATPVDVATLRRMAISEGGLMTDEIRCKVWPHLLNVPADSIPEKLDEVDRENNKDYNQVLLDVQRSLRRFPPGMPDEQRMGLQEELIDIILRVLQKNPQLHYYQGYHDIVVTFLLVLGERLATALVEKLSTHHLRDFMDPTMDNTKHILNYLMPIIERVNPEIVLYREEEVLDCECDMAMMHHLLSQIPQDLPYETLISRAGDLFVQFPPSELAKGTTQERTQQTAVSTFTDFELASAQQRPDTVLRRRRREQQQQHGGTVDTQRGTMAVIRPAARRLVRLAVMGITVALGAAALAVVNSALEWAPKLDLLFP